MEYVLIMAKSLHGEIKTVLVEVETFNEHDSEPSNFFVPGFTDFSVKGKVEIENVEGNAETYLDTCYTSD